VLVVLSSVEASYGATAHIIPHQDRKEMLGKFKNIRQEVFGFDLDKKKGNKKNLSPIGERMAFQAITDILPIFSEIQSKLRQIRSEWEAESPHRRSREAGLWRNHLKTVVAPQDYPEYRIEVLTALANSKRTPTYAACVHLAPFFCSTAATLYKNMENGSRNRFPNQ
jgi:hypothetical protein